MQTAEMMKLSLIKRPLYDKIEVCKSGALHLSWKYCQSYRYKDDFLSRDKR